MVATPLRLEDALRFNGFTIGQSDAPAQTITTASGAIAIPALRLSGLTWQRAGSPADSDAFYLTAIPAFDTAYSAVLLSQILDRFSTRRIGYDTLDMFGLAVRRWLNLNLGPGSILNRRYLSTAVALPLTTRDSTDARALTETGTAVSAARTAHSDFPQGQLAGNLDYATDASDTASNGNTTSTANDLLTKEGREGVSVMALLTEQRAAYLNVDVELLDALEPLFLQAWDLGEAGASYGITARQWLPGVGPGLGYW